MTLALGIFFSILAFILLAAIRSFDSNTFSFIQILVVTLLIGSVVYCIPHIKKGKLSQLIVSRELAIILIVFTLLSFCILNIDRSRSFYVTKWVQLSGDKGTTLEEISTKYDLSPQDVKDISQRISEQIQSGTLILEGDRLYLSKIGKALVFVSTQISNFENLRGYPKS